MGDSKSNVLKAEKVEVRWYGYIALAFAIVFFSGVLTGVDGILGAGEVERSKIPICFAITVINAFLGMFIMNLIITLFF